MSSFAILSEIYCSNSASKGDAVRRAVAALSDEAVYQAKPDCVSVLMYEGRESGTFRLVELYATGESFVETHDKLGEKLKALEDGSSARRTLIVGKRHAGVQQRVTPLRVCYGSANDCGGFVLHRRPAFALGMRGANNAQGGDDDNGGDDEVDTDGDNRYPVLLELSVRLGDGQSDAAYASGVAEFVAPLEQNNKLGLISLLVLRDGFAAVPRHPASDSDATPPDQHVLFAVFASATAAAAAIDSLVQHVVMSAGAGGTAELRVVCEKAMPALLARAVARGVDTCQGALRCDTDGVRVAAGFVLHPSLCTGDATVSESAVASPDDAVVGGGVCRIRWSDDGTVPLAFVFGNDDDDAATALANDRAAMQTRIDDDNKFIIPLRLLLRKLIGVAAAKRTIDAETVFTMLGRLRGLRDDIALLSDYLARNRAPHSDVDGVAEHRIECVLRNLEAFELTPPESARGVQVPQLADFVRVVEDDAYGSSIHPARRALNGDNTLEYGALFEYYHVNDIVMAAAPALGGAPVAYRVCDVFYNRLRSIFGGQKLSFHLVLECLVNIGDTIAFVSFDETLGDWEGAHPITNLQYRVVDEKSASALATSRQRGLDLLALGHEPAYRTYNEPCFFAHGSMANAATSSKLAAFSRSARDTKDAKKPRTDTGRLVVDTMRGMALGHSVAPGNDPACLAVQATINAYRSAQRARASGNDADLRERIKQAGLRLYDAHEVPHALAHLVWPAVVAFSLGLKRWGHVLVNGLTKVEPSSNAWDKLVLPASKKELLLSLVQTAFDPNAPRLRDLVRNKGSGALFLLHGAPGTGKTLTVEALAEKHALPMYFLSFGELGTSVKELEATMSDVLTLCSGWGALVLLDEGDALVERREKGALLLNSMVGVLLKSLDAFEGLLFITTNRVASFDPAALSRVTLSIRYGSLKASGRREVWRNVLQRAGADASRFDLDALAQRGGSGRDINAAARLALTLSYFRGQDLSQAVLMEVLDVADDFKRDFGDGLKAHVDGGRISDDENDENDDN